MSVIIPVRNRKALLLSTLDGLARQTFKDFEVIIVDDGSSDGSADIATDPSAAKITVKGVRTEGIGAVAARSAGVATSSGEILAFTDSDCVPTENWLRHGVEGIDNGADVVTGITRPLRSQGPFERSIAHSGRELLYATCNVFYRREAFHAAGGFDLTADSRLGFRAGVDGRALGFGEDTLLGWRVARSGRAVLCEDVVVDHAVMSPGVKELIWRSWMGGGFPALIREVPELRDSLLRHRVFLGTRRVPVYVTMALFAVGSIGGVRWLALVGAMWWAASRTRRAVSLPGSRMERMASVPVEMAIDAVMAVSLVWGSIRAQRIVL